MVSFVNPSASGDIDIDCVLRGFSAKSGSAEMLHHTDMNACNGFDSPETLVPKPLKMGVEGPHLKLTAPALSVITATLQA